jgi:hypothetical protein
MGKIVDELFPVVGTMITCLQVLHDLPADVPVGEHHLAVHRTNDSSPGIIENGDDPLERLAGAFVRSDGS